MLGIDAMVPYSSVKIAGNEIQLYNRMMHNFKIYNVLNTAINRLTESTDPCHVMCPIKAVLFSFFSVVTLLVTYAFITYASFISIL